MNLLENEIDISTNNLRGKVVLVGPTGVGKTTTIAKLAGRLALIEKKKVGLITIDTYRIGAVEQLKTYAEIMNIPFKVVITLKEMQGAVKELEACDVILVDTTGRSSKNTMQISELRAFIQKVNADHIMLVMSGTTKNRDIQTILEGYNELAYEELIITKLDETSTYGCVYNIVKRSNKPIAYITTGQDVPDDIKVPSKNEIEKLILGEETIC
jgi:flagellar biosynthesis protein FlhF